MEIKRGIAVSPGVAIGPALVLDTEWFRIPQRFIARRRSRRRNCAASARPWPPPPPETRDTPGGRQRPSSAPQYGAIFGAHALLLADPTLAREIEALIRDQHFAAEYAVSRVMRRYAKALESIDDGHLATRVADLFDIEKRILGAPARPAPRATAPSERSRSSCWPTI